MNFLENIDVKTTREFPSFAFISEETIVKRY